MAKLYYYTFDGVAGYYRAPRLLDVTFSGWTAYTLCAAACSGSNPNSVSHFAGNINRTYRLTRVAGILGDNCLHYEASATNVPYNVYPSSDNTCSSTPTLTAPLIELDWGNDPVTGAAPFDVTGWILRVGITRSYYLFYGINEDADVNNRSGRTLFCEPTFTNLMATGGSCYGSLLRAVGSGGTATIVNAC